MDIRAFGSIYGQTASLPYASGFGWAPAAGRVDFPSCRAVFIDAPGQVSTAINLEGNTLIPISCTALISGSVQGVFVLY
jgi:hypothetical protein